MKTRGIIKWPKLVEPDTTFEAQWNCQLEIDKEEATKLKAVGLSVKTDEDDDGNIVRSSRFSRKLKRKGKAGGVNPPPQVVDSQGNPMDGLIIGNGSEVIVHHKPFKWDNKFGSGTSTDLRAVQVVNLVEYTPEGGGDNAIDDDDDDSFEVIEGGFVASGSPKKEEKESVGELDF